MTSHGAKFRYAGKTSTFFKRDGRFYVNTDGPDGKNADFEIKYTFGVHPLQQYLIELPGGRMQAFGVAWDSRPKAEGGQRWFHLYPRQNLKAGDPLHWTGDRPELELSVRRMPLDEPAQELRHAVGYVQDDVVGARRRMRSLPRPGLAARRLGKEGGRRERVRSETRGWSLALDERKGVTWRRDPRTGNARRSVPRQSVARDRDVRALPCPDRSFTDDYVHGAPLLDSHRPALLDDGLYWNDGQMRDEVYNWGSFVQSAMYAAGVTCSDCHDPHSLKLRAPGNAVCARMPSAGEIRQHRAHAPPGGRAGCRMRGVSPADDDVHGRRPPARSFDAHSTS